jgi:general secretion pathway protein G
VKQRGITAVEFAVVLLLLSVLLAVLSRALGYVQEQAEKTMVRYAVIAIESGLKLEAASRMARGRGADVAKLAGEDPFQWVEPKPQGYVGEWKAPAAGRQAEPGWYWDVQRKEVVYVLTRSDHFTPGPGGRAEIRYRIEAGAGGPGDLRTALRPIEAYQWF